MSDFVVTDQRKAVVIQIFEAGEGSAPDRIGSAFVALPLQASQPRRVPEADSAAPPFVVLGCEIFGHKDDLGGSSDQFVFPTVRLRLDQGEYGRAVGWGDRHPALARVQACIEGEVE